MTRLLAALAVFFLAAHQDAAPKIGDAFPTIALKGLDGKEIKLADYAKSDKDKGKVVVVYFWSYECPSGRTVMGEVAEFAEWCKKSGVAFVAVDSYDKDTAKGAEEYAKKKEIAYPVVYDESADIAEKLGVKKVVETIVLDREGKIRYHGGLVGGKPKDRKPWAKDAVQALLDGKTIDKPETSSFG